MNTALIVVLLCFNLCSSLITIMLVSFEVMIFENTLYVLVYKSIILLRSFLFTFFESRRRYALLHSSGFLLVDRIFWNKS